MEEKTITLELSEPEVNVVWQTLMNGTVVGQNAPILVSVMGKIQEAVNEANNPVPTPEETTAESETKPEETKPEEPKSEEAECKEK